MIARSSLDFDRDGRDWPNRSFSRFVDAAGLRWHVQIAGDGPTLLLLHGTGAGTHSWRGLLPLLAKHFRVIAPDLPGHAFTGTPASGRLTLPGVARAVGDLLRALEISPDLVVGHSAGAAIATRMTLDGLIAPRVLVSINGAFFAFRGATSQFFSPIAKLLFLNPLVPAVFAWRASDRGVVERLLADTGSRLDARGVDLYARLVANSGHVGGALGMMASWNLRPLEADLPKLTVPLVLVVAKNDRTVSPREAHEVKAKVPGAELVQLPGLGHLAHEERPDDVARLIEEIARRHAILTVA